MAASGEFSCPCVGRSEWPLTLEEGDGDDPRHRAREKHLLSAEEFLRAQSALAN